MSAASPIRAAIVGAGLMGRWHAHAVAHLPGGVVAAIVDPDPARAAALARGHKGAVAFASLAEAFLVGGIDVVHVCAPLLCHAELAREALEAGRHTLVEKPLAPTARETEELFALAAARGRMLCPVHQFNFQRGVLKVQAAVERIGPLRQVELHACSAGAEGGGEALRDRVALEILPHPLSLFARLTGARMNEIDWRVLRPSAGELRAQGACGVAGLSIVISMNARPTLNALRVFGQRGAAHADLFHGYGVVQGGGVSRLRKIAGPFGLNAKLLTTAGANLTSRALRSEPAYPGLRELIRQFHDAARGDAPPPIAPEEAIDVARAADRIAAAFLPV